MKMLSAFFILVFAGSFIFAQTKNVNFEQRSLTLGNETYKYAVYKPVGKRPSAKGWPLIVFLHGAGERGSDGMNQTTVGIGPAISANPERFNCFVLMPQCRRGKWWSSNGMVEMMLTALDSVMTEFPVDPDSVSLTGLSLGGFGTWMIGAQEIKRFSALAPVCGGGRVEDAPILSCLPIWCFHGGADPVVPTQRSREMVEAIKKCGGDIQFTVYPGVGHNSWNKAYGTREFIKWLQEKKRPPAPPVLPRTLFGMGNLRNWKVADNNKSHWQLKGRIPNVLHYDGKGSDLWTKKSYKDFVLKLQWRLPEKGDSGIYLRGNSKSQVNIWCNELGSGEVYGYRTDSKLPEEIRKALTPSKRMDNPVGEWNTFVIRMRGEYLSVDLNGTRVIDNARLPGVPRKGPIALQSHGDGIDFKDISIYSLPERGERLFNGKNLEGWKAIAADPDTWTVRDNILCCSGKPRGFIRTTRSFKAPYILTGEWKLLKPGNSGLLLHMEKSNKVWPSSIEVQLDHSVFGNFIQIGNVSFKGGLRIKDIENSIGQWNTFMVVCRNDCMEVFMNGEWISRATACKPREGFIGFQSEGVPAEFRNIEILEKW